MRTLDAFGKCILASGIAAALLASPGTAYARGYSILYSFGSQNHYAGGSDPTALSRTAPATYTGPQIGRQPFRSGCRIQGRAQRLRNGALYLLQPKQLSRWGFILLAV